MPRRTILSDTELAGLLALPDTEAELIRRYTFSDADLAISKCLINNRDRALSAAFSSSMSAMLRCPL